MSAVFPDDTGFSSGWLARPPLEIVRDESTPSAEPAPEAPDEPNVGRSAMIGYAVGFLVSTVVITIAGTLAGLGVGASFGLGAFVGSWGGGGFGFMMGGTVPLARYLDEESHRARQAPH